MLKDLILQLYMWTGKDKALYRRANLFAIGFTGNGKTTFDDTVIKRANLKPLNRFELWLMKGVIDYERERRQKAWRTSCMDVIGEDPNEW